jgi:acetolactate synthase-1/2/3 large subunit
MSKSPFPAASELGETSTAEVFLRALAASGIEYFFANPGTDFAPIVEAFSRSAANGSRVPRPIVVPHENCAVAMAHGVYQTTGKPQAVMVHVNVGTGNTLNAIIDASRDQAPILLLAGRTPLTEQGLHGSRNRHIHWAQEMFDQAGMLREFVKWDYELRLPAQAETVVARALEVMMTSPRGPAYMALPREVLGAAGTASNAPPAAHAVPALPHPDPAAIDTLAQWIAAAERPLVITGAAGRTAAGMAALARVAERFALPVVCFNARYVCLPASHPMHMGFQPRPLLEEADLVIALDSDVPWYPSLESPPAGCRVVQIGEDPAFTRYPIRSFPADLAITAETTAALGALEAALAKRIAPDVPQLAQRRQWLAARRSAMRAKWAADGETARQAERIKPEWISRCVADAVGEDAIIVNEYPLRAEHCLREKPGTYFGLSPAGGLGWGLGAALGMKLAAPDRLVVATLGDGAYMFANPTACHWVSAGHHLPVLTVVFNNQLYGAVRNSTLGMYADGVASKDGGRMLADLTPAPAYEKLVEASGGHGERVEDPAALPAALARAVQVVKTEKRQALLNVVCQY